MTGSRKNMPKVVLLFMLLFSMSITVWAKPHTKSKNSMVGLNLPKELELKVLIDYVAKRKGINFIYDDKLVSRKMVTINAPKKVPADTLVQLLESVLKMNNFVMYPDETGMIRIEPGKSLPAVSAGLEKTGEATEKSPSTAATRIFQLEYADVSQVEKVVKPFCQATTANVMTLPNRDMVIITDYASNMPRLAELISLVDKPSQKALTRFVTVRNLEAVILAKKVKLLLDGQGKAAGASKTAKNITVIPDERTNKIAVIGSKKETDQVITLIESLDVPLGLETKIYELSVASPEQINELVENLIGELAAKRLYKSAINQESNMLIVTTTPEIHLQVDMLCKKLDKPTPPSQSPIRFYKLENADVTEVLGTLQNIEGDEGLSGLSVDGVSADGGKANKSADEMVIRGPTQAEVNEVWKNGGAPAREELKTLKFKNARIMADIATNTLIIIAKPSVQAVYKRLIDRLDIRRPQVLIEATIVMLDTTDGFSLGVEFSTTQGFDNGNGQVMNFSSFGLSTVDAETGRLTINPSIGYNGVMISANIADIIIQALESDSRAKVLSKPSILINDNATGTLVSEKEEPYASVNASTTVATTSFGGYSKAGTKINITPHISEGDYLKLEYQITLSSFDEKSDSDSLPPSRQTNSLESEATIPDGFTIVVGGLSREDFTETIDRVPFLGRIPGLEYAFSNRSKTKKQSTLFVFIRARTLREDKFKNLKSISSEALRLAELDDGFPVSEPVEIQ